METESAPVSTGEKNFNGMRVVSFESRMAQVMEEAIRRHGGDPLVAPSMREIPLDQNADAISFGEKLMSSKVDIVVFMTGVGARYLLDVLERHFSKEEIIEHLNRIVVIARGPKPVQVLEKTGIKVTLKIPEPNTWEEIVEAIDFNEKSISAEGAVIAVQEYGVSNAKLIQALKKRRATVIRVPVYRWALPEDKSTLIHAVHEVVEGRAQVVLFTSATQVHHVLQVAAEEGLEKRFTHALNDTLVASIGPVCSETLAAQRIMVDFEPSHSKMGQLIAECSKQAADLIRLKEQSRIDTFVLTPRPENKQVPHPCYESPFMKACRREPVPYTPIWLMRQAGRYMKEYRTLRNKVSFMDLCLKPELAAEVAITACEKIGADAAILFSDILLILEPLGLGLEYAPGDGPVISGDLKTTDDVKGLREIEPAESLGYVFEAVKLTRACLNPKTPLIGFSGAPFTLASYALEGGSSRIFLKTKQWMYNNPESWHSLMLKITRGVIKYLNGQIEAGADAVQIFDSWVGCLSPEDYRTYVLPYSRMLIHGIRPGVPVIHFGTGTATFLEDMREAGGDVIGADYRIGLDDAWQKIGYDKAVQGNLDPIVLCSSLKKIKECARVILDQAENRPGHIFNLGHGILPSTPVDHVIALIDIVHELSRRK